MDQQQLLTLSDVARLAEVRRPVVSMWRKRPAPSGLAFPAAATMRGSQELFAAEEIADWLAATGRGNNPEARLDVAAHAVASVDDPLSLTALIALQALAGRQLSALYEDEILDLADEADPDDAFLYSEVEALNGRLLEMARLAENVTDAAYSADAALETVRRSAFHNSAELSQTRLAPAALSLVAGTANELARRMAAGRDVTPTFIDASLGGSDVPFAIMDELGETAPGRFALRAGTTTGDDGPDSPLGRLAERRLRIHLQSSGNHETLVPGTTRGPIVHIVQYPAPGRHSPSTFEVLTDLEGFVQHLGAWESAVVLAPAGALTDEIHGPGEESRSRMLRNGRIRASVRLPEKLLPASPRRAMALWVLGPAHADIPIADRWTMVADLTAIPLDVSSQQDLISDLSASLGTRRDISSHAFRFARLVPTRTLLATGTTTGDPATPPPTSPRLGPSPTDYVVQLESALRTFEQVPVVSKHRGIEVSLPSSAAHTASIPEVHARPQLLGKLLSEKKAAYLPGTRIMPDHLGEEGIKVWEADRLGADANHQHGQRINALLLAANYPRAGITEPGDIVFRTGPSPAAVVDRLGSAVVRYPARILRVGHNDPGLVPAVIADDINSASGGLWRQWPMRCLSTESASELDTVLAHVDRQRDEIRDRLARLDDITSLLIDGATAGVVTTLKNSPTMEGRP